MEEAEHLRHSYDIKQIYASVKKRLSMSLPMQRKSMVCDGQPSGLKKLSMQAYTYSLATMNLKKLAVAGGFKEFLYLKSLFYWISNYHF
ncbi:hypothetical protein ABD91_04855 [Lysinibacillus sphaericus]|nr:hypothetical protein [Lysinibacillus sphaericus]